LRLFNHLLNEPWFGLDERGMTNKMVGFHVLNPKSFHLPEDKVYESVTELKEKLRFSDKVIIDNIHDSILDEYGKIPWNFNAYESEKYEFPNCRPPFPVLWLEFKDQSPYIAFQGALLEFKKSSLKNHFYLDLRFFARCANDTKTEILNIIFPGEISYAVDALGTILDRKFMGYAINEKKQSLSSNPYMYLFSISLMNCKNVSLIEPNESKKLADKRERKSKPAYRYHVLKVNPMSSHNKTDNLHQPRSEPYQSLHICRGHFKDYREKGLFGKYQGIYWWDSHLRGDMSMGIVDKDYELVNNN